jgi:hypothetical protein
MALAAIGEHLENAGREKRIAVVDQVAHLGERTIDGIGCAAGRVVHPLLAALASEASDEDDANDA